MHHCPSCAAENTPGARFCNQCGTRLDTAKAEPARQSYTPKHLAERILKQRSALRGEKKRVTVLFCDIKGSTRLAQQAGPEAWHGILDRFFGLMTGVIHRYEGTVNQYTGDGLMALFGAPLALEDHAQRAALAALEMQRELRRYADELRLKQGLNLTLRVGLNSGEVIVGSIGDDLRMDYTAQGHTVNLAARMEQVCEPGHIYLTRHSARLIEGYFALRSLGQMQIAGVDEAVEVFDLEGQGSLSTRLDRSLLRAGSPFIGRTAEIASLLGALDQVRGGQGQVVAVVGEAGIGKSRLCHEFLQGAAEAGFEIHRATGVPYANALPLHPVRTLALSRLGLSGRSNPAEVRRLVAGTLLLEHPEHAEALPAIFDFLGASDGSPAAPEQAALSRQQLFDLLAQFLPCPNEHPLVLLIEDLHFLDAASAAFLQHLADGVRGHRTLLLLNYRPDYDDAWLADRLAARVAVTALEPAQLTELARTQLGDDASVASLANEIGQRAGGNPFFVEEAVQALADAELLQGSPRDYRLVAEITEWPIPDTVHALLAARIDRLPEPSKTLLQTAAIFGEAFAPGALASLSETDPDTCAATMQRLDESGFLLSSSGEFTFRHPLMREVADGLQLASQRARSHARLAQMLSDTHAARPSDSEACVRIAHHWQQAAEWARAGEWNLHAARWAATRDLKLSIEQFMLALTHLDRAPASAQVQHLRIAARAGLIRSAQFIAIPLAEVESAYRDGRTLAAETGDIAGAAELIISYGNEQLHRCNAERAAQLHAEAVALCLSHGHAELIRRFRLTLLISHFSAGRPAEGIALVDAGDNGQWRRDAITDDNMGSRGFHSLMLAWQGALTEAQTQLDAVLNFAMQDQRNASWMHAFKVDLNWLSGDHSLATHHAQLAVELAAESGSAYFQIIAGRALAIARSFAGDYTAAINLLESLSPLCAPGSLGAQFEPNHLASLARAYHGAGRCEDAARAANAGIASAQQSGTRVWEIYAWLALLELPCAHVVTSRVEEGLARMAHLIAESDAQGFMPHYLMVAARWQGDDQQAQRLRAEAAALWQQQGAPLQAARVLDDA